MKQYLLFSVRPDVFENRIFDAVKQLGINKKDCKLVSETKAIILAEPQKRKPIEKAIYEIEQDYELDD